MNDCCNNDECIRDDEQWDCDCYSHNQPTDTDHEKNPRYRGLTHDDIRHLTHEQLMALKK